MKKMTLVAAALSACLASGAHATSTDNAPNIGGGDGVSGDLILAAVNALSGGTQSVVVDLSSMEAGREDMTHGQLLEWAGANPGGSFTIDTGLNGLIDSSWSWHVFSFANVQDGSSVTNVGVLTTVNVPVNPSTKGSALQSSFNGPTAFVNNNINAGLPDNGLFTATNADDWYWDNGNNEHGEAIFTTNTTFSVGEVAPVQLLSIKPGSKTQTIVTNPFMIIPGVTGQAIDIADVGTFQLFDNGQLQFNSTVVPVPAAVWLFGSAILGVAGISRKTRA